MKWMHSFALLRRTSNICPGRSSTRYVSVWLDKRDDPSWNSYFLPLPFKLPTVLAKIFGFYSIGFKNAATGKSMRMDVLIMENLFYQRNVKKASPSKEVY